MARRTRTVKPVLPEQTGAHEGLAFSLWHPPKGSPVMGGVVILHGAASCKENHHDYCRAVLAAGFAALAFDQRGHGESRGPMDGRALQDVIMMTELLRSQIAKHTGKIAPIVLRGSSMGGYLALVTAAGARVDAVVAICPASGEGLARALDAGRLDFDADVSALKGLLAEHDLTSAVGGLDIPILLMHAEGDEQVPVEHSRELARGLLNPVSRLIAVPGGHHRSIQHDPEMVAVSLRWMGRALRGS